LSLYFFQSIMTSQMFDISHNIKISVMMMRKKMLLYSINGIFCEPMGNI